MGPIRKKKNLTRKKVDDVNFDFCPSIAFSLIKASFRVLIHCYAIPLALGKLEILGNGTSNHSSLRAYLLKRDC